MKNKAGFWITVGVTVGVAIGITTKNFPAALFIGAGTAMLLMIVTNLEADKKIKN